MKNSEILKIRAEAIASLAEKAKAEMVGEDENLKLISPLIVTAVCTAYGEGFDLAVKTMEENND